MKIICSISYTSSLLLWSLHVTLPNESIVKAFHSKPTFSLFQTVKLTPSSLCSSLSFEYEESLPESKYTQVISIPDPSSSSNSSSTSLSKISVASKLRQYFDDIYQDPRAPDARRFIWDPWYVKCSEGKHGSEAPLPGDENLYGDSEDHGNINLDYILPGEREAVGKQIQYSLKRVQASAFFSNPPFSDNNNNNNNDNDNDSDNDDESTINGEDISLYEDFIDEITTLGRSIGLQSTTPPWISLYTHNDLQNFHTDASHGPMAWVYPLPSPKCQSSPTYEGGDTMLLHPTMLDYWNTYATSSSSSSSSGSSGKELPSIIRFIPSTTLGKCIAFDGRVPHGVSQVKMMNPNDVREGRLVLHGWFADPQIIWNGFPEYDGMDEFDLDLDLDFDFDDAEEEMEMDLVGEEEDMEDADFDDDDDDIELDNMTRLNNVLNPLIQTLGEGEIGRVMGYLAVNLQVLPDGSVGKVSAVCDTLVADPNDFRGIIGYDEENRPVMEDAVADVKLTIYEALKGLYFTEYENFSDNGSDGDGDEEEEDNLVGNPMREVIVPFAFE